MLRSSVVSGIIVVFIVVSNGVLVTLLGCDDVSGIAVVLMAVCEEVLVALFESVDVLAFVDCVGVFDDAVLAFTVVFSVPSVTVLVVSCDGNVVALMFKADVVLFNCTVVSDITDVSVVGLEVALSSGV